MIKIRNGGTVGLVELAPGTLDACDTTSAMSASGKNACKMRAKSSTPTVFFLDPLSAAEKGSLVAWHTNELSDALAA